MTDLPAILGGTPAFPEGVPFTRPTLPPWEDLAPRLEAMYRSGNLTKGPHQRRFEARMEEYLQVPHVVAVSSCTSGLMLAIQSLGLEGEVIVPSYSFMATFHALRWCRLTPVFVDCEPETLTVDVEAVRAAVTPRTVGVMAVSLFGNPPDWPALEALCEEKGLALFSDSAHGLGTLFQGRPLGGWGCFEVFSLSPTKLLPAAEGGLVATRDERIASWVRSGRDYGNPGSYDCDFAGLNARMSEFHALLGLAGVDALDSYAAHRNRVAEIYHAELAGLPGLRFQRVREGARSSYKDFPILIDPELFGIDRDHLGRALQSEGIPTRAYFFPPGHEQTAYADLPKVHLPQTEKASRQVLCLPIASHMDLEEVRRVAWALRRIHSQASALKVSG